MPSLMRDLRLTVSARPVLLLLTGALLHCGSEPQIPTALPTAQRAAALLSFSEQSKLSAADAVAMDNFGCAQDIDGDTIIVGAKLADPSGLSNAGAAYIYTRSGTTWTQQAKLVAMDGAINDQFGFSVAISGDTAVVGAYLADIGAQADAGAVYVYSRSGTTWSFQQKLTAMDGLTTDRFGQAVAIDGTRIVVGAPQVDLAAGTIANAGALYVFDHGTTWTQKAKITTSDSADSARLGWSVAIEGAIIAAGASEYDPTGKMDAGAGFIYEDVSGTFNETKLTASDGLASDKLGTSVGLAGNTVIFGAPLADVASKNDAGAAYVYVRAGLGAWSEQAKLTAPAAEIMAADSFASSVAIVGNLAVIGATASDPGGKTDAGAAYAYSRSGTTWSQTNKLVASDAAPGDNFGLVAMSRNTAVIGALAADLPTKTDAGAAYVLLASLQNGDACANNFECGSGFCVDGVCCDGACGGGNPLDCQSCLKAQTGLASDGSCGTIKLAAAYACRTAVSSCDVSELCDGVSNSCPTDKLATVGTVCRPAASGCDVAETCDGMTTVCPMDKIASLGAVCRPAIGPCDVAESCDGVSAACPANTVRPSGIPCRSAIGVCDVAESCDGVNPACPADQVKPIGFVCLPAGADPICDPADTCDGVRRTCAAHYAPRNTACTGGLSCNGVGHCG